MNKSKITHDDVLKRMMVSHHRGFPVTDNGRLVGIITQIDLKKLSHVPLGTPLSDFMNSDPLTIKSDTSLSDILYFLDHYQFSRVPVVEEDKLVDVYYHGISRNDKEKNKTDENSKIFLEIMQKFGYYKIKFNQEKLLQFFKNNISILESFKNTTSEDIIETFITKDDDHDI